jgi:hypothetical protein
MLDGGGRGWRGDEVERRHTGLNVEGLLTGRDLIWAKGNKRTARHWFSDEESLIVDSEGLYGVKKLYLRGQLTN